MRIAIELHNEAYGRVRANKQASTEVTRPWHRPATCRPSIPPISECRLQDHRSHERGYKTTDSMNEVTRPQISECRLQDHRSHERGYKTTDSMNEVTRPQISECRLQDHRSHKRGYKTTDFRNKVTRPEIPGTRLQDHTFHNRATFVFRQQFYTREMRPPRKNPGLIYVIQQDGIVINETHDGSG